MTKPNILRGLGAKPPEPPRAPALLGRLQKQLLGIGLAVMAATTFVAPYRITGVRTFGTLYRPLWASTDAVADAAFRQFNLTGLPDVTLDAGTLGIWWAGIIVLTASGMALAGKADGF